MENVDLTMKVTDERAFDEMMKLLDFIPEDPAQAAADLDNTTQDAVQGSRFSTKGAASARVSFLNDVAQNLLDL